MRVFVTGGSGYVGSAVVRELVGAGHAVTGLARSAEGAARLDALGAAHVRGDVAAPEGWAALAGGEHDAVIHVAQDGTADDRLRADWRVLAAVVEAGRRTGEPRSFVYTSNAFLLGDQGVAMLGEDDALPVPGRWGAWRLEAERAVLATAGGGVTTAVVRPGQVYGGNGGTLPMMFGSAVEEGAAVFVGDGANRWSLVHRDDLARLFRRVVEARACGVFHGVDGHPLAVADVARWASEAAGAGGRIRALPLDDARREWGGFAEMLALDVAVAPVRARALGWTPAHPSFSDGVAGAFREWADEGGPHPAA